MAGAVRISPAVTGKPAPARADAIEARGHRPGQRLPRHGQHPIDVDQYPADVHAVTITASRRRAAQDPRLSYSVPAPGPADRSARTLWQAQSARSQAGGSAPGAWRAAAGASAACAPMAGIAGRPEAASRG